MLFSGENITESTLVSHNASGSNKHDVKPPLRFRGLAVKWDILLECFVLLTSRQRL